MGCTSLLPQKSFMLWKSVLNLSLAAAFVFNDRPSAEPNPSLALGIT